MIKEYWITNISKFNVSLADLGITVPAYSSVNLLKKSNRYTIEQIEASVKSGSISKKSDKIKIRNFAPDASELPLSILTVSKQPRIANLRSVVETKEDTYEELLFSDEKFAEEFADMIDSKK